MHYRLYATEACNRKSRGPKRGPEALNVLECHRLRKPSCLNFKTFYLTLLYYHYCMLKRPFYEQQSKFSPASLIPVERSSYLAHYMHSLHMTNKEVLTYIPAPRWFSVRIQISYTDHMHYVRIETQCDWVNN